MEKLFNEGKNEADVIAARPLKDLDAKWAASDDAVVASPRWSKTPSSGRAGGTVARRRPRAGATLSSRGCELARAFSQELSRWRCGSEHVAFEEMVCALVGLF